MPLENKWRCRVRRFLLLLLLAVFAWTGSGCSGEGTKGTQGLTVALYPYIPRLEQFKEVIESAWKEVHPESTITWAGDWDGGYYQDPDSRFDIYVYDACFLDYFRGQNWLYPIPEDRVPDRLDFFQFVLDGVLREGHFDSVPQLLCTNILFYEANDPGLGRARTLSEVTEAIGTCTFYDRRPQDRTGAMVNFSESQAIAFNYVQSEQERTATFPIRYPWSREDVNLESVSCLKKIIASSSLENVLYDSDELYVRAEWFGQGSGRAYVGFTESLSRVTPAVAGTLALKRMPWADNPDGIQTPLFYSDLIAVHPATLVRGTTGLAMELVRIMSSSRVLTDCIGPYQRQRPQYLMPARISVFEVLADEWPLYGKIEDMVRSVDPILMNLGPDIRDWLRRMPGVLEQMTFTDLPCYCDHETGPIWDDEQAQESCPQVCADYNGWNGRWTTPRPDGMSTCGCNEPCGQ